MIIDKEKIVSEMAKITEAIQEISKTLEPEVKVIKQTCYNCKHTNSCAASEMRPSEGCDVWGIQPQILTANIIKAREVDPTQPRVVYGTMPTPSLPHLCDTCIYTYPECNAYRIIWGIELNPKAKGKEADSVVVCSKYANRVT